MKNTMQNLAIYSCLALGLSLATPSSVAASATDSTETRNNTITQWGPWEHGGIEPSAGGLSQALEARKAKFALRINSASALAPRNPTSPNHRSGPRVGGPANELI